MKADIQNGSVGKVCPQSLPSWGALFGGSPIPLNDPRITEDCLVLDVLVSKKIFDNRNTENNPGAPVMIWIHVSTIHLSGRLED